MLSELVKSIHAAGWSEAKIAQRVGCSQPTIHRIRTGKQTEARYSLVVALQDLQREVLQAGGDASLERAA